MVQKITLRALNVSVRGPQTCNMKNEKLDLRFNKHDVFKTSEQANQKIIKSSKWYKMEATRNFNIARNFRNAPTFGTQGGF